MDKLSNFFSLLNIAYEKRCKQINIKNSKIVIQFVRFLYLHGFIDGYSIDQNNFNKICIFLKYVKNKPLFLKFVRVSMPGRRVFLNSKKFLFFQKKYGLFFISNSKLGIVSSISLLKNENQNFFGGEVLARVIF